MRVLLATEFYHRRGGAYALALDTERLLREHGHEVIPLAAAHPQNEHSPFASSFVRYESFPDLLRQRRFTRTPSVLAKVVYNREAARRTRELIRRFRPDVMHAHNVIQYLSPSVLVAARDAGVPVVFTLHDHKLMCPDSTFLCHAEVCERCRGGRFYQCLLRRCKRGSWGASAIAAAQAYCHHLPRVFQRTVDAFVTPSAFLRRKLIEWGWPAERTHHIPNFVFASDSVPRTAPGEFFLYAGRLDKAKGVGTLLDAARGSVGLPVRIAGDGAVRNALEKESVDGVEWLGHVSRSAAGELMRQARAVIVPSIWYENCSLTVLEAMAGGTPVICSRIGGLPEQIQHDVNGLMFEPGDAQGLADCMRRLAKDAALARKLGEAARTTVEREYSPERHYRMLMALYGNVCSRHVNASDAILKLNETT